MRKTLTLFAFLVVWADVFSSSVNATNSISGLDLQKLKKQNVIWHSPSLASKDAMPIGNGDIGINVWNDPSGDLMLYIGKTDAFDESCRLLKLGRLRVHFSKNPFVIGQPFHQELDLLNGEIRISAGSNADAMELRIWVDANRPVIHLETNSASPIEQSVKLELWRTEKIPIKEQLEKSVVDGMSVTQPPMQYPDILVDGSKVSGLTNRLIWYHRNEISIHPVSLKLQEIDPGKCSPDPLINRTFGCTVMGKGFVVHDTKTLHTAKASISNHFIICVLTEQTPNADVWLNDIARLSDHLRLLGITKCRVEHQKWWEKFWERSWINVSGGDSKETSAITQGWYLNRFLTACTARGNAPVKFNGGIFNVDGIDANGTVAPRLNADARAWGPGFWFQNMRHIYWPMLEAGDYEQLIPFFKMYHDALPLAKESTQTYFRHDGAFFSETMYLWGTYLNDGGCGYGWNRTDKELGLTDNQYIRRYWQGGIELSAMMLEYYQHTQNKSFVKETLLPLAESIVTFYDQHYKRDEQGKIIFYPAQMLESFWDVLNPMPEIAGLNCIIEGLLDIPQELTSITQRTQWKRILSELPSLPITKSGNTPVLGLAETVYDTSHNIENGNLYAVWPYKRLGLAFGNLKLAQDSYTHRWHKGTYQCWMNDNIYAAFSGLANEATDHLAYRFVHSGGLRFPTFYTDGDWVPDFDNGGVCQNTIQSMLMQTNGRKIFLLPAWPKEWNVSFKLHAPYNTTVQCEVKGGKILNLIVYPENRRTDIVECRGLN